MTSPSLLVTIKLKRREEEECNPFDFGIPNFNPNVKLVTCRRYLEGWPGIISKDLKCPWAVRIATAGNAVKLTLWLREISCWVDVGNIIHHSTLAIIKKPWLLW